MSDERDRYQDAIDKLEGSRVTLHRLKGLIAQCAGFQSVAGSGKDGIALALVYPKHIGGDGKIVAMPIALDPEGANEVAMALRNYAARLAGKLDHAERGLAKSLGLSQPTQTQLAFEFDEPIEADGEGPTSEIVSVVEEPPSAA